MILPNVILTSRIDQRLTYSGIDSPEHCVDPQHFNNYPWPIEYVYNSRGFRDQEWPLDPVHLQSAVWCVGDSFTVGIGSTQSHIWPAVLQKNLGRKTINVSMDGASNNWIARTAANILQEIAPTHMVIHWSYIERREGSSELFQENFKANFYKHYESIKDSTWPRFEDITEFGLLPVHIQSELLSQHDQSWRLHLTDEQLRQRNIRCDFNEDIKNTRDCIAYVDQSNKATTIVHSFIPDFVAEIYRDLFYQRIESVAPVIKDFKILDRARDGHHYDRLTSEFFVDQLMQYLR